LYEELYMLPIQGIFNTEYRYLQIEDSNSAKGFCITATTIKPKNETAYSTLQKIHDIIVNEKTISATNFILATGSSTEIWEDLVVLASKVSKQYVEQNKTSFIKNQEKCDLVCAAYKKIQLLVSIKVGNTLNTPQSFRNQICANLPADIMTVIFSHTDINSLSRLSQLNRNSYKEINSLLVSQGQVVLKQATDLNFRGKNVLQAINYLKAFDCGMQFLTDHGFFSDEFFPMSKMNFKKTLRNIAEKQLPRDYFIKNDNNVRCLLIEYQSTKAAISLLTGWGNDPDQLEQNNTSELDQGLHRLEIMNKQSQGEVELKEEPEMFELSIHEGNRIVINIWV
jgi:hypothetical protein